MSDIDTAFTPEETAAIDRLSAVYNEHKDEIVQLNQRQAELRRIFRNAFRENSIDEVFQSLDERDGEAWDTPQYSDVDSMADSLGLGFSYEGYYLWTPSTQSC